jgi:hypothetical protein
MNRPLWVFGVALVVALAAWTTARAQSAPPVLWECGSFEVPTNTWNRAKESWTSPSENGLLMQPTASGQTLPAGWTPIGGGGGAERGTVVACHPISS